MILSLSMASEIPFDLHGNDLSFKASDRTLPTPSSSTVHRMLLSFILRLIVILPFLPSRLITPCHMAFSTKGCISPGDTIVVPLDVDRVRPITLWTNVSQIIYQLAIAAASAHAVGVF